MVAGAGPYPIRRRISHLPQLLRQSLVTRTTALHLVGIKPIDIYNQSASWKIPYLTIPLSILSNISEFHGISNNATPLWLAIRIDYLADLSNKAVPQTPFTLPLLTTHLRWQTTNCICLSRQNCAYDWTASWHLIRFIQFF